MVFWLNIPTGYTLSLENLKEQLTGRVFREDISDQIESKDDLRVPDVFKENGEVVSQTSVDGIEMISSDSGELLFANLRIDDRDTVSYRGDDILMMDNQEANLLIFEHEGYYYLVILANRSVAAGIPAILRQTYSQFGSAINTTRIMPKALQDIRESLDASLVDTIISDFPQKEIRNLEVAGSGFETEDVYQEQRQKGQLKNHMFQTTKLLDDGQATIRISRDGLVRIYSNAPTSAYLQLLWDYVLPEIHRDVENSPSLTAYKESGSSNPIYVPESDGS